MLGGMDRRQEIRQFLASRRARLSPESAGLVVRGEPRRVPGLRREEVAVLAEVSVDYYVRLERGNLSGASDSVLEGLARALRLNDAERRYLYDLATSCSKPAPSSARAGRPPTSALRTRRPRSASTTRSSVELQLTAESMHIHSGGHLTPWAATAEPGSPSEASLARLDEWAAARSGRLDGVTA